LSLSDGVVLPQKNNEMPVAGKTEEKNRIKLYIHVKKKKIIITAFPLRPARLPLVFSSFFILLLPPRPSLASKQWIHRLKKRRQRLGGNRNKADDEGGCCTAYQLEISTLRSRFTHIIIIIYTVLLYVL